MTRRGLLLSLFGGEHRIRLEGERVRGATFIDETSRNIAKKLAGAARRGCDRAVALAIA